MAKQVVESQHLDTPELTPAEWMAAPTAPSRAVRRRRRTPSYTPTGMAFIDSLLLMVDDLTRGKAGLLQRAFTYLMFGGVSAVVNLVCLYVVYQVIPIPVADGIHWWLAQIVAAEVSIMANFLPNDRFTFSRLPGHARSWWTRCWRFHSTAIAGVLIMVVVSTTLHLWLGVPYLLAQAASILVALCWNFTIHHLWTYRHIAAH
jgi:putative flippase GtrA